MWYLKQLLPLKYKSRYSTDDGVSHHTVWRMWFGHCFAIQDQTL